MGRIKNPQASPRVLSYLRDYSNTDIPAINVQKALDMDATTVSNAIVYLRSKGLNIVKPSRGIYRYVSGPHEEIAPKPTPNPIKLYEYVGQSGELTIVRGEDMQLYIVTCLDEAVRIHP
jgi:hypothetical protein